MMVFSMKVQNDSRHHDSPDGHSRKLQRLHRLVYGQGAPDAQLVRDYVRSDGCDPPWNLRNVMGSPASRMRENLFAKKAIHLHGSPR